MNADAFIRLHWAVLLLVLGFFGWWALAQDSPTVDAQVAVVSPFAGDVVSDSLVVLVKPENPADVSSVTARLVPEAENSEPLVEQTVNPENNWTTALDTSTVPDGTYVVEVESCAPTGCETKPVPIQIANSDDVPSESPTVPPIGTFVELIPSNWLSALYVLDATTSKTVAVFFSRG